MNIFHFTRGGAIYGIDRLKKLRLNKIFANEINANLIPERKLLSRKNHGVRSQNPNKLATKSQHRSREMTLE